MTDAQKRGRKAAATLKADNPDHFREIGAEGGKKTPGTFKTKRGLAKKAGKRSGQVRKLKGFDRKIETLRGDLKNADDADTAMITQKIAELEMDKHLYEIEINGGHHHAGMEYEQ